MRKNLILTLLILLLFLPAPAYAGDINDNEQTIIDRLSTAIEYHGKTYYASDEYITQVRSYLSKDDVDFSATEVSLYMEQFNGNIYSYVRDGYLSETAPEIVDTTDIKDSSETDDKKVSEPDSKKLTTDKSTDKNNDTTSESDHKTATSTQKPGDVTNVPDGNSTADGTDTNTNTNNEDSGTDSEKSELFAIDDITRVDSSFMNYIDSIWFVIVIFLFFLFAIAYIVINRKIIFDGLAFLKVILIFACTSVFLMCTLTTLFFANDRFLEETMTQSGYYEYIYSQTANYIRAQEKIFLIEEDVPGLTDYVISKRFSRSQIRLDVESFITEGTVGFNQNMVADSMRSAIDDFNKDTDLFSVSITNDNLKNWIYNVSVYYSDRISFEYARNTYLLRRDIKTNCDISIGISGLILLIETLNLLINRKKHMLRRLQYIISAVLLTVPVLLIFILFAATGNIFILSSGIYSESDNLFMQAAYESRIVTNFQNSCVNSSFYFLMAFLTVICAIHFLVRYYSNKKYGTQ